MKRRAGVAEFWGLAALDPSHPAATSHPVDVIALVVEAFMGSARSSCPTDVVGLYS